MMKTGRHSSFAVAGRSTSPHRIFLNLPQCLPNNRAISQGVITARVFVRQ